MITGENFEAFCLDYYEGRLSKDQQAALFEYLDKHPELLPVFQGYEEVRMEPENFIFPKKTSLKKTTVSDDEIVAYLEGDLPAERHLEFAKRVAEDKALQKNVELFLKTQLKSDFTVTFPHKASLKHFYVPPFVKYFSAAAILAGMAFLLNVFKADTEKQVMPEPVAVSVTVQPPASTATTETIISYQKKSHRQKSASPPILRHQREIDPELAFAEVKLPEIEKPLLSEESYAVATVPFPENNTSQIVKNKTVQEEIPTLIELAKKELVKKGVLDEEGKGSLWKIAELGAKGLSNITGSHVELQRKTDPFGNRELTFTAGKFSYSKVIAKK